MAKTLRLVMVGAFALLGGSSAAAASGGGAIVSGPVTCEITTPGGTVSGTGRFVITPSGTSQTVCQAQLPANVPAPAKAVRTQVGPCMVVVAPSGLVHSSCNNG